MLAGLTMNPVYVAKPASRAGFGCVCLILTVVGIDHIDGRDGFRRFGGRAGAGFAGFQVGLDSFGVKSLSVGEGDPCLQGERELAEVVVVLEVGGEVALDLGVGGLTPGGGRRRPRRSESPCPPSFLPDPRLECPRRCQG